MTSKETEVNNIQPSKPSLSKSWSEVSAHTPSYSGGKVTLCHTTGIKNLYGYEENENEEKRYAFILAPCAGDLSLIDATKGIKVRTIREGCFESVATERNEDDNDEDAIVAYALAPNDYDLVIASRNNIISHYDISGSRGNSYSGVDGKGPAKVRRVLGRSGHDLPICCIEFHCSGIFFATGSIDGNVKVWDLRGGYITHSYRYNSPGYKIISRGGLRGSVSSIAWCPDLTKLLLGVGRDDGTVRIHDLRIENEDEDNIIEMSDHVGAITCMVWAKMKTSNRYDTFFTAGRDEVINLWNIEEVPKDSLYPKPKRMKNPKHYPDDSRKTIYKRISTLPTYESVEAMILLPNFDQYQQFQPIFREGGSHLVLATAGSKGVVRLWKAQQKQLTTQKSSFSEIIGFFENQKEVSFGQKRGGYTGLLLSTPKHNLNVVNLGQGLKVEQKNILDFPYKIIAIDAEHNMSFFSFRGSSNDWKGKLLFELDRTIVGHNDEILDLCIIPDPEHDEKNVQIHRDIAVATNSAQIRLFDLTSYSCSLLDAHTETVLCLDVSPCGRYLVSSGKDKTTRLWHLKSKRCIAVATGHTEAIGANALSRKRGRYDVTGKAASNGAGSFLVTASKDKTLKRWNLPGSKEINDHLAKSSNDLKLSAFCSVRAHEKDINIVSVAPNDSLIATGSQDKLVKLWNSTDLTLKGVLKGHKRGVWDCQFSEFDKVIATCSGDKSIKLWSLGDCSCVRTFQGHSSGVLRVRFLSAGMQLVSCDGEGVVRTWNIRKNECTVSIEAHDDKIWALDVSKVGDTFVTGSADSSLKVFNDTTSELEEQKNFEDEKRLLMEQKLANHLRFKEFDQALNLALEMEKPRQTFKVLSSIIANDIIEHNDPIETLRKDIANWSEKKILQILQYCREWNTVSRNSHICMLVLKAIFVTKPIDELSSFSEVGPMMEGIMPYARRHFDRLDNLYSKSYLVDFTLSSMGDLGHLDNTEYSAWEFQSSLVLPPQTIDGRIQSGGQAIVGARRINESNEESDTDVLTVGESDSSDDSISIDSI